MTSATTENAYMNTAAKTQSTITADQPTDAAAYGSANIPLPVIKHIRFVVVSHVEHFGFLVFIGGDPSDGSEDATDPYE